MPPLLFFLRFLPFIPVIGFFLILPFLIVIRIEGLKGLTMSYVVQILSNFVINDFGIHKIYLTRKWKTITKTKFLVG